MPVKRFGARYGLRIKKKLSQVEKEQKKTYQCPYCLANSSKRVSAGIWQCRKCKAKYTGASYSATYKVGEAQ